MILILSRYTFVKSLQKQLFQNLESEITKLLKIDSFKPADFMCKILGLINILMVKPSETLTIIAFAISQNLLIKQIRFIPHLA